MVLLAAAASFASAQSAPARWTEAQANAWYAKQPWLVGANFVPSDAINELEMFQAATFNPALIDKELGMAESIGMNTMRVFLQDQLWQQDADGFKHRLDVFLGIAAKHHIRPSPAFTTPAGCRAPASSACSTAPSNPNSRLTCKA
jgi:hypothetical protein